MKYILEIRRADKDWVVWITGDLQVVLSDFFYLQTQGDPIEMRIIWSRT